MKLIALSVLLVFSFLFSGCEKQSTPPELTISIASANTRSDGTNLRGSAVINVHGLDMPELFYADFKYWAELDGKQVSDKSQGFVLVKSGQGELEIYLPEYKGTGHAVPKIILEPAAWSPAFAFKK